MNSKQRRCCSTNPSIGKATGCGTWQQNDQKQISTNILNLNKMTKIKKKVSVLSSIAVVCIVLILGGCSHDTEVVSPVLEVGNTTGQVHQLETRAKAPWEKVRYDYSYLTPEKIVQANQYLETQKLSLEDLEQLHDLVNTVFGDGMTKLVDNFSGRSLSLLDESLFDSEDSKLQTYLLLMSYYNDLQNPYNDDVSQDGWKSKNPHTWDNIRLVPSHFGERDEYLFISFRVPGGYALRGKQENNRYHVFQVKRDNSSRYGWKIYNCSDWGHSIQTGKYEEGPWTISHFNTKKWEDVRPHPQVIEFLDGKRDKNLNIITKSMHSRFFGGNYNNHIAASYSYNHAYNYNSSYYNFAPNDCANFASQCLYAGGLPQDNTWYYNSTNPYNSKTWISCTKLFKYLTENHGYSIDGQLLYNIFVNGYYSDLKWGDLVFMNKKTDSNMTHTATKKHVMVITHSFQYPRPPIYDGVVKYKVSGHTTNQRDVPLDFMGKNYIRDHMIAVRITYGLA